jgi:hypothetical protein
LHRRPVVFWCPIRLVDQASGTGPKRIPSGFFQENLSTTGR